MKPTLALLIATVLAAGLSACGTSTSTGSSSQTSQSNSADTKAGQSTDDAVPKGGYLRGDNDNDPDEKAPAGSSPEIGRDEPAFLEFGRKKANPEVTRTVTALVKSYYAASAAEDGAKACTLLSSNLIHGLAASQGKTAGNGCAKAMILLLKQQHRQLMADDVSTMVVTSVHTKGNLGAATLGFRAAPEGSILLEREGGTWKIDAIFASGMS